MEENKIDAPEKDSFYEVIKEEEVLKRGKRRWVLRLVKDKMGNESVRFYGFVLKGNNIEKVDLCRFQIDNQFISALEKAYKKII